MKKALYEVAILLHPTQDEVKAGKSSEIILNPRFMLAQSQEAATILAAREIPDTHLDKLDRIEVAVRPF